MKRSSTEPGRLWLGLICAATLVFCACTRAAPGEGDGGPGDADTRDAGTPARDAALADVFRSDALPVCHNGHVEPGEPCDDGNTVQWDGCHECEVTEIQVNTQTTGHQTARAVAVAPDGRFVVIWDDVIAQRELTGRLFDAQGYPEGGEFKISTESFGSPEMASVAMAGDGHFVVVWNTFFDGILARRFHADGSPDGGNVQVSEDNDPVAPNIAMLENGDHVVVWVADRTDPLGKDIIGQRFDAAGTALEPTQIISPDTDTRRMAPRVALHDNGGFVVVWTSTPTNGDSIIEGRRCDADGTPIGSTFPISVTPDVTHLQADVAAAADGRFVVIWRYYATNPDLNVCMARRYQSTGAAAGSPFQVNALSNSIFDNPRGAMAGDGRFVLAWGALGLTDPGWGVAVRRYAADGTAMGDEFLANTHLPENQLHPALAMNRDGRFVLAWSSVDQDGDGWGVFVQHFDAQGRALGARP